MVVLNSFVPNILALDFDGVLCDGRGEYLESSWRVYREIWGDCDLDLEKFRWRFYELRSVIETGWEMPLLLRALQQGISDEKILENWSSIVQDILNQWGLTQETLTQLLDEKRDRWIETNQKDWLAHHQFYPHVISKIQEILSHQSPEIYIITTKEGRFAKILLEQQGIIFPKSHIFGKECHQPKRKTLTELSQRFNQASVWFVEDRLKTLLSVEDSPELKSVQLFLATWGYNTARSRSLAKKHQRIHLLSLDQFNQDFSQWLTPSC